MLCFTRTLAVVVLITCIAHNAFGDIILTDWTTINTSTNTATGTLDSANIVFSGTNIYDGTTNGTSTRFDNASFFTPSAPMTDAVLFAALPSTANYNFTFDRSITDPIIHFQSLAGTLTFTGLTINKVSGETTFVVSGDQVSGVVSDDNGSGSTDANGTIQLDGTFSSIDFTARYSAGAFDGIGMQFGADQANISSVPEPSSFAFFGLAAAVAGVFRLFQRKCDRTIA